MTTTMEVTEWINKVFGPFWRDASGNLVDVWSQLSTVAKDNMIALGIGAVLLISLFLLIRSSGRTRKLRRWEMGNMSGPEQEQYERMIIADALCDALEETYAKGKLSGERVNFWYARFGHILSNKDLLTKATVVLKEASKKRRESGEYKPVKLPDADVKPVEVAEVVPLKDRLKRRQVA